MKCIKCGEVIEKYCEFPSGLCVRCYGNVFDHLPDNEKIPDFNNIKLLNL